MKKEHWTDKAAMKIADYGIKLQTKFSNSLNERMANMSVLKLKILLVLFCFFGGGLSIYFISEAILKQESKQAIRIDQVQLPKYYDKTGTEELQPEAMIDKVTYEQIKFFKEYMDSLQGDNTGKIIYDSILLARPGLMDSIQMLEEIYLSQSK